MMRKTCALSCWKTEGKLALYITAGNSCMRRAGKDRKPATIWGWVLTRYREDRNCPTATGMSNSARRLFLAGREKSTTAISMTLLGCSLRRQNSYITVFITLDSSMTNGQGSIICGQGIIILSLGDLCRRIPIGETGRICMHTVLVIQ